MDPDNLLDNFQDLDEIHKIIVFQTGYGVKKIALDLDYSRPHLQELLSGKGSDRVTADLIERLKSYYKDEIIQFVRKYKSRVSSDPANSNPSDRPPPSEWLQLLSKQEELLVIVKRIEENTSGVLHEGWGKKNVLKVGRDSKSKKGRSGKG
jgi:hypothetical protein